MGYVVAANPLGQMLFSPLVGWWGNKRGSVRIPLLLSLGLFTLSSGIYSSLEIIPGNRKNTMVAARFLVGVSSGIKFIEKSMYIMKKISMKYFFFYYSKYCSSKILSISCNKIIRKNQGYINGFTCTGNLL